MNRLLRKYYIVSFFIWLFAFLLSFIFIRELPHIQYNVFEFIEINNKELLFIFFNNLRLVLCNLFGVLSFGILPFTNLLINGFILGGFVFYAINIGMPISRIIHTTLPHFTEYLAIFISAGFGLYTTSEMIKNRVRFDIKNIITWPLVNLLIMCTSLILFAAIAEVYIAGQN